MDTQLPNAIAGLLEMRVAPCHKRKRHQVFLSATLKATGKKKLSKSCDPSQRNWRSLGESIPKQPSDLTL